MAASAVEHLGPFTANQIGRALGTLGWVLREIIPFTVDEYTHPDVPGAFVHLDPDETEIYAGGRVFYLTARHMVPPHLAGQTLVHEVERAKSRLLAAVRQVAADDLERGWP